VSRKVPYHFAIFVIVNEILIFEDCRKEASSANASAWRDTRRISWKVPKEESDSVGSSPGAISSSFVASKSRESYNEEIFASSAIGAASA